MIYIVIVTYNGIKWIDNCLNSIPNKYRILIVDNNSNDGTVSYIKKKYSFVHLIEQSKNLGFGAANNIGISYALNKCAEYVFLLNQDAYLEKEIISSLIKIHKENKDFGVLSPIHLNGAGTGIDTNFSNYININKQLWFDALKNKFTKDVYEVPFVNAAAWLVSKETLETIGGFDPLFFHYGEDNNFCQRSQFHKIKVGVVPNVYIYHDREDRTHGAKKNASSNFNYLEQKLKNKWANINIDATYEIDKYFKKKRKLIFKLFVKFQFKKYLKHKKELNFVTKLVEEIMLSKKINKTKGSHYLKI